MRKVLIIEDNQDVRETTADIIELANYKVITAEDGKDGIKKALKHLPDLILCDIMMPEINGYGVFQVLHDNSKTASIPFIFLTAKTDKSDIRKGMNLGADDYLTKPFEEHELLDAISCRLHKNDFLKKQFAKNIAGFKEFFEEASTYLDLEILSKGRNLESYKKGEIIFNENRTAHSMYLIEKGAIKTYKATESGKDFVTGMSNAGDFIGQLSLLSHEEIYIETAIAIEDTEVYSIPKDNFLKLLHSNKIVASKFIELISNDLVDLQSKLVNMAYATVKQRAAKALLDLYNKGLINDNPNSGVGIPREDFAGIIGTATETAIRTLTQFKEDGLITVTRGRKLKILDKNGLELIARI